MSERLRRYSQSPARTLMIAGLVALLGTTEAQATDKSTCENALAQAEQVELLALYADLKIKFGFSATYLDSLYASQKSLNLQLGLHELSKQRKTESDMPKPPLPMTEEAVRAELAEVNTKINAEAERINEVHTYLEGLAGEAARSLAECLREQLAPKEQEV